jgi:hypothetical protein
VKDDQLFAKSGVYICALLESSSGLRKREIEQLQSHIDGCGGAVSTSRALGRKATAHKKETPLGLPLKQRLAFTKVLYRQMACESRVRYNLLM